MHFTSSVFRLGHGLPSGLPGPPQALLQPGAGFQSLCRSACIVSSDTVAKRSWWQLCSVCLFWDNRLQFKLECVMKHSMVFQALTKLINENSNIHS